MNNTSPNINQACENCRKVYDDGVFPPHMVDLSEGREDHCTICGSKINEDPNTET